MIPVRFTDLDDLQYIAGFGLYYLRIDGLYYKRLRRGPWQPIPKEQIVRPVWSKLNDKQRKTFVQQLVEQGFIQ